MKGPKITIETSCMDCKFLKSREPAVDDLFRCELLSNRVKIGPYTKTPNKCPFLYNNFKKQLKTYKLILK